MHIKIYSKLFVYFLTSVEAGPSGIKLMIFLLEPLFSFPLISESLLFRSDHTERLNGLSCNGLISMLGASIPNNDLEA
jgi:hypothetical protein